MGLLALPPAVVHGPARTRAELGPHGPADHAHAGEGAVDVALEGLEVGAVAAADDGVGVHGRDAPGAVDVEGDLYGLNG
jgi:hypothetical protein